MTLQIWRLQNIHTHIYTYIHTHTYIHTYIHCPYCPDILYPFYPGNHMVPIALTYFIPFTWTATWSLLPWHTLPLSRYMLYLLVFNQYCIESHSFSILCTDSKDDICPYKMIILLRMMITFTHVLQVFTGPCHFFCTAVLILTHPCKSSFPCRLPMTKSCHLYGFTMKWYKPYHIILSVSVWNH